MPAQSTDPGGVTRLRLAAQGLTGREHRSPDSVVEHLLAIQAQDLRGARLAVRARSLGLTAGDLDAAFDGRRLVVGWLNRGTLHLVTAADFWWLRPLTNPQLESSSRRRLQQEGVSAEQAERGVRVVADTLAAGPADRDELRLRLDEAGVPTAGQALVHVLLAASLRGLLVRGPVLPGGDQAFVDPVSWLGPEPAALGPDEALGRLAERYLAAHAPASAADLAAWAGITLGRARRALAVTGCPVDADGLARLPDAAPPSAPDGRAPAAPAPVLLGPFDPVLHGWPDRTPLVGDRRGVVTSNGVFRATVLVDGRVVGTWGLAGGRVTVTLLEPVPDAVRAVLERDAAEVLAYLGLAQRPAVWVEPRP